MQNARLRPPFSFDFSCSAIECCILSQISDKLLTSHFMGMMRGIDTIDTIPPELYQYSVSPSARTSPFDTQSSPLSVGWYLPMQYPS